MKIARSIDTFEKHDNGFFVEFDGWHFEARSEKAIINKILKYVWEELGK